MERIKGISDSWLMLCLCSRVSERKPIRSINNILNLNKQPDKYAAHAMVFFYYIILLLFIIVIYIIIIIIVVVIIIINIIIFIVVVIIIIIIIIIFSVSQTYFVACNIRHEIFLFNKSTRKKWSQSKTKQNKTKIS